MSIEKIILGAGCFWGVEAAFSQIQGVISAPVGYSGGNTDNPTYEQVCTGKTGHAEVIELEYDSNVVSLEQLLNIFFQIHDPTTLNRQGPDVGTQYRSAIFFVDAEQELIAKKVKEQIDSSGTLKKPIVTEIKEASTFWRAEEYHQKYFAKRGINPTCHNF